MGKPNTYDFGYSAIWTYGHAIPGMLFSGGFLAAWATEAAPWITIVVAVLALWSWAGFFVSAGLLRPNAPMHLPTEDFLSGGGGTVLDLGCGSGRTSIMVAQARSTSQILALDNFSADYIRGHAQSKTRGNFLAAGIANRASIDSADMCEVPLNDSSVDAIVSSYAIDHLDEEAIVTVFDQARRVLRDDGEFLLMVIVPNIWTTIAYGPLVLLGFPFRGFWRERFRKAGFVLRAEGTSRGTAWFLARKGEALEKDVSTPEKRSLSAAALGKLRRVRKAHSISMRQAPLVLLALGLILYGSAWSYEKFELKFEWWWVAVAIPVGLHAGLFLMLLSGVAKWFTRKSG